MFEAIIEFFKNNPETLVAITFVVSCYFIYVAFKAKRGMEAARKIVQSQHENVSPAEVEEFINLAGKEAEFKKAPEYMNYLIKHLGNDNLRKGHLYWVLDCSRKNIDITSIPKKDLPSFKETDKPVRVNA